jgi:hypothetical protein
LRGTIDQVLMQCGAANAEAIPGIEAPLGRGAGFGKSDAAKRQRPIQSTHNSKTVQRGDTIRHQPFAAWFVDRWAGAIDDENINATKAKRDRGS